MDKFNQTQKKKYEFRIEDIHTVLIVSKSESKYTNTFSRKYDEDGNPTLYFIQTYNAEPEEIGDDTIRVICNRCEGYNVFDKSEYFDNEDFKFTCDQCADDYEDIIHENELIDIINSYMDEEYFFDVSIFINFIPIE